jgi:hypothetical protein
VYYKQEDSFLPGPLGFVGAKKAYDDRDYYGAQLERVNDVNEKNLKNKDAEYVVDPENIDYEDFKVTQLGDYYTHHVTIRGLDPVSKYYFVVSDNWFSWSIKGVDQGRELTEIYGADEFNFTTFDRLNSVPSPNPAYGKVVGVYRDEDGFVHDNLNQDTVVYGFLFDEESLDQTSMYSSVTNEEGGWVIDKASMRSEDGSLPYNFKNEEDLLVLYPQYMNLEESFSVGLILGIEDSPAPDLVGGQEVSNDAEEESLIKSLLGTYTKEILASEVVETIGGSMLVIRGSPEMMKRGKGHLGVVGTGEAASYMRTAIDATKGSPKSADNLVQIVVDTVDDAVVSRKKDKKINPAVLREEIKVKVGDKAFQFTDEELAEQLVDDIRNNPVSCARIRVNGKHVQPKDYWAYNCFTDLNEKPEVCTGAAVAAGCGTQSACYQGSGGDRKKCTGCTRPASCANVWSRPEDIVVNGQLYTLSDVLNAFHGDGGDNPHSGDLKDALNGKVLCLSGQGRALGIVSDASRCPAGAKEGYGSSLELSEFTFGDNEDCKRIVKGFGGENVDVGSYCVDPVVVNPVVPDPSVYNNKCPLYSVSCNEEDKYNCVDLECGVGYKKIFRPVGGEGCLCRESYDIEKSGFDLYPDPENGLLEEGDLVRKQIYTIKIDNESFRADVSEVEKALDNLGIYYTKVGTGSTVTLRLIMSEEEKEELIERYGSGPGDVLNTFVVGEGSTVSDRIVGTNVFRYSSKNGLEYHQVGNNLFNRDELLEICRETGISFADLEGQLERSSLIGNVRIPVEGNTSLFVVNTDELLENIKNIYSTVQSDREGHTYEYPPTYGYTPMYSYNYNYMGKYSSSSSRTIPTIIYPEEAGEKELQSFEVCIAPDSETCTPYLAASEGDVRSHLGTSSEHEAFGLLTISKKSTGLSKIVNCPNEGDCYATFVGEIIEAGEEKTIEYHVEYTNDSKGINYIFIDTQTGRIPLRLLEEVPLDEGEAMPENDKEFEQKYGEEIEEQVPVSSIDSGVDFLSDILGIFSPTKVQAQQLDKYVDGSNDKGLYEIITSSGKTVHYVDTTNQSYIIFYEEGNGEPGFQEPLDINNPKDGEDVLVFVNKDSVKKISQAYQYWIEEGINMMSFPFLPVNQERKAMMASDLMISNNTVVKKISQITYFENGKWQGGIKASGDNKYVGYDFPLVPGRGYLIVGEYGTNISIPGFPLSKPYPMELSAGWNFVGVHGYTDIYTAEKLIDELDKLEGIDVDNVTWWPRNLGRYEGLQKTGSTKYGFDYPLSDRLAYFVRVASYSNKCPRSVLWNPGGESHGICGSN